MVILIKVLTPRFSYGVGKAWPRPHLVHCLLLSIKFYWNTAAHSPLRVASGGCVAELDSCNRDLLVSKAKISCYLAFHGKSLLTSGWLAILGGVESITGPLLLEGFGHVSCSIFTRGLPSLCCLSELTERTCWRPCPALSWVEASTHTVPFWAQGHPRGLLGLCGFSHPLALSVLFVFNFCFKK